MDENQRPLSLLDTIGEEITRIIAPVSICMFLEFLLVLTLDPISSSHPQPFTALSSLALLKISSVFASSSSSSSNWHKILQAILTSLAFVAMTTTVTFLLLLLFYFKCTKLLKFYMGISTFAVLGFLGGEISLLFIQHFRFPLDCFTFVILLFNFASVGVISLFVLKTAIILTQFYLVVISVMVAYWFAILPEWTTWVLLVALALYDIAAVLLPFGPLRLLVELAISREEEIPGLVYEARPVVHPVMAGEVNSRLWKDRMGNTSIPPDSFSNLSALDQMQQQCDALVVNAEEGRLMDESGNSSSSIADLAAPLLRHGAAGPSTWATQRHPSDEDQGIGLSSSGAIKLGLGDFIFYSVLVGRAAMYDFMTVFACYLAIIAGLGITLMLLAVYRKVLPALPVSISLGLLFYFLTRLLLESFIIQCSSHLVMF